MIYRISYESGVMSQESAGLAVCAMNFFWGDRLGWRLAPLFHSIPDWSGHRFEVMHTDAFKGYHT